MFFLPADAAITPARLARFAPRCDAASLAPLFDQSCNDHGISTPARVRNFLPQVFVETWGLTRFVEDLDYSNAGLLRLTFPGHFADLAAATPYVRQPQLLADRVYGGRFGNTAPDDGWRYRGRGALQITFKDNYAAMTPHAGGVDLVADPDALAQPALAIAVAASWWEAKGLNALADTDRTADITRVVTGGATGLLERRTAWVEAMKIWPRGASA